MGNNSGYFLCCFQWRGLTFSPPNRVDKNQDFFGFFDVNLIFFIFTIFLI